MSAAKWLCVLALSGLASVGTAADHPRLLLTAESIAENPDWHESTLFSDAVDQARHRLDSLLVGGVDIPEPVDAGGGYTHETHKRNAITIHHAGMLYQWTGEKAYAQLAADMLGRYATLYPTLGEHPRKKEQSPGRLFWQSLNEAVWLVYAIQGYDAIFGYLSANDKQTIERNLLRPMADFLSHGQPQTFDKIHNHGAWAAAAVGMTGFVLEDDHYVDIALRGLSMDGTSGFLKQLDELFSPQGYYTEGPYYQRYALMPFVVFARAIEHNRPDERIFRYRDGIVLKAIDVTVQLSYGGKFFPLNDAIKDKGLDTIELDHALAIAYGQTGDETLLSLFNTNAPLILTGDGLQFARAVERGDAKPFVYRSMLLGDGARGDQGGLVIMRHDSAALVFKATSQGMGHGHFDRLNWLYYDNGNEVITDYGAARFLNVVQKNGGHYLPENSSWAKQTIAHNTLTVDGRSHFGGDLKRAEQSAPVVTFFDASDGVVIASANEPSAYPGVVMSRVLAHISTTPFERPIVIDLLKAVSGNEHRYDLPVYYRGSLIDSNVEISAMTKRLEAVGDENGFQHLWLLGKATADSAQPLQMTWLLDNRFYSHTSVANVPRELMLVRIGAGDPQFSLRPEPGFILRTHAASNATFVSVLEPHGEYNGAREFTVGSESQITDITHESTDDADLISIQSAAGDSLWVLIAHDADQSAHHRIEHEGHVFEWRGFYRVVRGQMESTP